MMIDLLLGPYVWDHCDGKACIWMDNCRIHAVQEVADYFKQHNIEPLFYPANMTPFLQVLDLTCHIMRYVTMSYTDIIPNMLYILYIYVYIIIPYHDNMPMYAYILCP